MTRPIVGEEGPIPLGLVSVESLYIRTPIVPVVWDAIRVQYVQSAAQ